MSVQTLNGIQIFATGLEHVLNNNDFQKAYNNVVNQAFLHLFEEQALGKLEWRRSGEDMRDFVTDVTVKNALNKEIIIFAFFVARIDSDGYRNAFLTLGSREKAPCRNDADERVKNLFTSLTGKEWEVPF